ncbi:MAG: pyridoxal kinase PdxY [Alphaproteobacteria bacterium]
MKQVLSINSSVAYGHVGNAAAVPALQRLGVEVWPLNTVTLSNHTGHASWRGRAAEAGALGGLVAGLDALGVIAECDALLTGYLANAGLAAVARDALGRLRAARPDALYLCDPVMGNAARGFYVADGLPEFIRDQLAPRADIVTPNGFELAVLTGLPVSGEDEARAAARALRERGPDIVVCTSLEASDGGMATLAVAEDGAFRVMTPRIEAPANGAGDLFAALFLGHTLGGADMATALSLAVSGVYATLAMTAAARGRELALVAALDALAAPPEVFKAEPLC